LEKFLISHPTGYFPFKDVEADLIDSKGSSGTGRDGESDDTDIDLEVLDDFPLDHTPGWVDPTSFSTDEIDGLLVLIKGGRSKSSRVVPIEVSYLPHQILILGSTVRKQGRGGDADQRAGCGCRA
jgi:hypothetical protein